MNEFIKVCPACGFSFKPTDPTTRKKIERCPMCGYKIREPSIFPETKTEFDDTFI